MTWETSFAYFLFSLARGLGPNTISVQRRNARHRVHELEERLAGWLLMWEDIVQSDQLPITQEFLAMMLGTRRTTVTVAAGMLHKAELVAYSRGNVTIQNREGLELAACECYRTLREEYVRLGFF